MSVDWIDIVLIGGWFWVTLATCFFVRRARVAFIVSALLSTPEIAYTIFKVGSVERFGIVHVICA